MFNGIAGDAWADWPFMAGLAGIGLALTFGVGMRAAAAGGALLYLLMWVARCRSRTTRSSTTTSSAPSRRSTLALTLAGDTWGFGKAWSRQHLVAAHPILR